MIPKKPGFLKEQNAGFSAQIKRVTLVVNWTFNKIKTVKEKISIVKEEIEL